MSFIQIRRKMRNYRIDFNLTDPFPDGRVIGRIGEKNAASLVITPPAEMADNENITNYVAVFATARGTVETDPYPKAEQFTVAVTERLSVGYSMAIQLEGRDDSNNLIVKTPLVHGLTFEASAVRCGCGIAGGFPQNTALPSHYHRNLAILDKLGEAENALTFNGKPIIGAQSVKTLEITYNSGDFDAMIDCCDTNSFSIFVYNDTVPKNATLFSVEMKVIENNVESDWIDLRDMYFHDVTSPYTILGYRALPIAGFTGLCVATVHFLDRTPNKFYDYASASLITALRVAYIDESGAE